MYVEEEQELALEVELYVEFDIDMASNQRMENNKSLQLQTRIHLDMKYMGSVHLHHSTLHYNSMSLNLLQSLMRSQDM